MPERRFCLVDEPWIPIAGNGRVSLLEVFSDDSSGDIDGNAVQKLSIIKLMIAIAQASVAIDDNEDWKRLGYEGLAGKVCDYLKAHRDCFYLYGDRPFLQMPQVKELDKIRESRIFYDYIPDLASDNDSIIRSVQGGYDFSDAEKAVFLVGLMNYALGGKRITSTDALSPGFIKSKSAKSGPGIGNYLGYLNTCLKGRSLRETVWFNFFTDRDIKAYGLEPGIRPPWEKMPLGEDDQRARELHKSVYSWLVALSRFVLLGDEGIYYAEGLQYPGSVKDGYSEPFITIDRNNLKSLYVDVSKKPWRSLTSILQAVYNKNGQWDCMIVSAFLPRVAEVSEYFTIWTGGLRVRGTSGDQSVKQNDDYVESEFVLCREIIGAQYYDRLCSAIDTLEKQSRVLWKAVEGYYGKNSAEIQKEAAARYWESADSLSTAIIGCWSRNEWEEMEKRIGSLWYRMLAIYDEICSHDTERGMNAWVQHRPGIKRGGKNG